MVKLGLLTEDDDEEEKEAAKILIRWAVEARLTPMADTRSKEGTIKTLGNYPQYEDSIMQALRGHYGHNPTELLAFMRAIDPEGLTDEAFYEIYEKFEPELADVTITDEKGRTKTVKAKKPTGTQKTLLVICNRFKMMIFRMANLLELGGLGGPATVEEETPAEPATVEEETPAEPAAVEELSLIHI